MKQHHSLIVRGLLPALAVISAAVAVPANAADLGPYRGRQQWNAPPPGYYPQAFRWSGFYGGVQLGYGWGDTDAQSTTIGTGATQAFNYSSSGAIGGVHMGYNFQASNLVFGLETDIELARLSSSGLSALGEYHSTNIDWMGSLRARFGYAIGNTLLYATGGLAYAGISTERAVGSAYRPFAGSDQWKAGWTLGAGVEHAFTSNISARLEYRYTDFGSVSYTNTGSNIIDSSEVSNSAIRAGLSFKF